MLEIVPRPGPLATIMSGWSTIPPRARRSRSIRRSPSRCWRGGGGARLADHPDLEHPLASRSYRRQRRDPRRDRLHDHRPAPRRSGCRRWTASSPAATGRGSATIEAELIDIPAHTAGHVAFHLPAAQVVVHRRHPVRDGLRPAVRGHGRADAREHAAPGRAAARDARLLRRTNIRSPTACSRSPSSRTMRRSSAGSPRSSEARDRGEVDAADDDRAGARDQPVHARAVGRGAGRAAGGEGHFLRAAVICDRRREPGEAPSQAPTGCRVAAPRNERGQLGRLSACTARPAARRKPP